MYLFVSCISLFYISLYLPPAPSQALKTTVKSFSIVYIVRPFDDESILLLSPPSPRSNLMFRCALRKIDNIDDDEVMDNDDSRIKNKKE